VVSLGPPTGPAIHHSGGTGTGYTLTFSLPSPKGSDKFKLAVLIRDRVIRVGNNQHFSIHPDVAAITPQVQVVRKTFRNQTGLSRLTASGRENGLRARGSGMGWKCGRGTKTSILFAHSRLLRCMAMPRLERRISCGPFPVPVVGSHEIPGGSRRHTAARGETMGSGLASHRAGSLQPAARHHEGGSKCRSDPEIDGARVQFRREKCRANRPVSSTERN